MVLTREAEVQEEKPVPVPLCRPQISPDMGLDRVWSTAVRSRRLTCRGLSETKINFSIVKYPLRTAQ